MDADMKDLLEAISEAMDGMTDWRAIATRSALGRVLAGQDDPGAAADWLREFLAQRAEQPQQSRRPIPPAGDGRDPQTDWLTAAERARLAKDREAAANAE